MIDERTYGDRYADHQERHGTASCPVEVGVIGNLADNECEHGSLPSDKKPACACFTAEVKRP